MTHCFKETLAIVYDKGKAHTTELCSSMTDSFAVNRTPSFNKRKHSPARDQWIPEMICTIWNMMLNEHKIRFLQPFLQLPGRCVVSPQHFGHWGQVCVCVCVCRGIQISQDPPTDEIMERRGNSEVYGQCKTSKGCLSCCLFPAVVGCICRKAGVIDYRFSVDNVNTST